MSARWEGLRRVFRLPLGARGVQRDVEDELSFHLEERVEDLMQQGLSRADAEQEARRRFGDLTRVGSQLTRMDLQRARRLDRLEAWRSFGRDLRISARSLRRRPGYALAAILTLGIGLGATGAIFTLVQRVILDPLPYPAPDRLVRIRNPVPGVERGSEWNLSTAQYFHYRRAVPEFEAIGLYQRNGVNATASGMPQRVQVAVVTASLLPLLGARARAGRLFGEADDVPGAPGVAVVSYGFWRDALGGDRGVLGKPLRLNEELVTVIGVMAPGVELPWERGETAAQRVDLWLPMQLNPAGPFYNHHVYPVVGRLAPGTTLAAAQRRIDHLRAGLPEAFPNAYSAQFLERYGFRTVVYPLKQYVLGDLAKRLWILFAAVGLVLAIACANVTNLLLVRLETRRREFAVRSALGAGRRAVAREALAEGGLLALSGTVVGALLSIGSTRWLEILAPAGLGGVEAVRPHGSLLYFLGGLGLLIAGGLALVPLLQYGNLRGLAMLGEGGRSLTTGARRQRVRGALVALQVALALMLVVGSSLLLQSFRRLRAVDPGVDPGGVLTLTWYLPQPRYDSLSKVWRFEDAVLRHIRALPGVVAAGASEELPFVTGFGCTIQGFEEPAVFARLKEAGLTSCSGQAPTTPGYFEALRIPLLRGRLFSDDDNLAPERGAAIVTKAFAERFWPGEDPIGKAVNPNGRTKPPFYHVVGVVGDLHGTALDEPPAIGIFYPIIAMPGGGRWYPGETHLVVRTSGADPLALLPEIRRAVQQVDPGIPIANAETMTAVVARTMGRLRFTMLLLAIAGSVALALAAVGLYGLISYLVAQRTNELGVRLALGARPGQVERLVVRGALRLTVAGLVAGTLGAAAAARVLRGLLYGVAAWDLPAYLLSAGVLLAVAGLAGWIPARRAARVDPVRALREE
ncbi:MAG TPA: ABC transporter permease [Gemmatimonadales bacterium]|nr:ABC transporter permease [Gemmatimonadales bacterium]